jgi:hypothetical protein
MYFFCERFLVISGVGSTPSSKWFVSFEQVIEDSIARAVRKVK